MSHESVDDNKQGPGRWHISSHSSTDLTWNLRLDSWLTRSMSTPLATTAVDSCGGGSNHADGFSSLLAISSRLQTSRCLIVPAAPCPYADARCALPSRWSGTKEVCGSPTDPIHGLVNHQSRTGDLSAPQRTFTPWLRKKFRSASATTDVKTCLCGVFLLF